MQVKQVLEVLSKHHRGLGSIQIAEAVDAECLFVLRVQLSNMKTRGYLKRGHKVRCEHCESKYFTFQITERGRLRLQEL